MVATIYAPIGAARCRLENNPAKIEPLGGDMMKITFVLKPGDDPNLVCSFFLEINGKGVGSFGGSNFSGTVSPR